MPTIGNETPGGREVVFRRLSLPGSFRLPSDAEPFFTNFFPATAQLA
jgi:hypothetical protein